MAEKDMTDKIQSCLNQGESITEDQVRSLMILVRKHLELMSDTDMLQFLTLNLFCNWCAHIEITQSNTGLRTLAKINDVLVRVKNSTNTDHMLAEISGAIGLDVLRAELITFLSRIGVTHRLDQRAEWAAFLKCLLEVVRDVPLAFPPIAKLNKGAQKIYDQIAQNPIKPGAGVIRATISKVDYGTLGAGEGELWCLLIRTEDTTTLIAPLRILV
ncbi:MAG: hypothetical protein HGB03_02815 [Candidatus Yonathbacteria bacterium]|nr:hypothetical protein [Candidatus Yonathbacteria bacterium]NTW47434.1 hypothetical protein [Candidatus Yonathbacteria bacterium]